MKFAKKLSPIFLFTLLLISIAVRGTTFNNPQPSSHTSPSNVGSFPLDGLIQASSSPSSSLYESHPSTHSVTGITVTDPGNAYDNDPATYASFAYTTTGSFEVKSFSTLPNPWRIVRVDFKMRYSTTISSNDDKYRIVYYVDPSTTPTVLKDWKRDTTTLDTYVWYNRAEPDDGVWSWTDISNIRFVVETLRTGGGDSDGSFLEYEAWVTVTYQSPTVYVDPPSLTTTEPFSININIDNMDNLYAWEFNATYNTAILTVTSVTEGFFLQSGGSTQFNKTINDAEGWVYAYASLLEDVPGVTGSGVLATIDFSPDAGGETALNLHDTKLVEYDYLSKKTYLYPPYYIDEVDGYVNVPLAPPPDFSLSASPSSLTIQQGTSDTSTITVTSLNGFTGTVDLTVSGEPSGVTATLDPTSVTPPADGSDTSTLTVEVDLTASVGVYTLTVTGTSGALVHSVDVSLEITEAPPPPDFSISADPASLIIQQGTSDTSTITVTSLYGFTGTVDLTVSGEPSGVTSTLDPTSVTPPADGSDTSTLTVEVDLAAAVGVYTLTVTGTSGALVHSVEVSLEVTEAPPPPDFSMSAEPASLVIQQGSSDTSTITVTSLHGFTATVDLSVSGEPSGVTSTLDPTSVTPPAGGSDTSTLTVEVDLAAAVGVYTLTVTGTSGALVHSVDVSLEVTELPPTPDFSLSASPSSLTIQQGMSDTSTITVTSLNGFTGTVALTVSGEPSGVTATLDPTSVTPPADGSDTSTLTVQVDLAAAVGVYTLTVTGTSGALVHSVDVSLEVTEAPPPPDFSMSAEPASLIIQRGTSDTSTITVTSLHGFTDTVDLTVSGEPSGVTATLDPTSVTPPADGSYTSTLTVEVDLTATTGVYTLTVTGTSGALVHSVDVSLEVTELPPPQDFSMSADPASLIIQQGASDTSTITVTSLYGFAGTVDLTVSGAPSGVTATLDPTSVTPPADGSDTSTLTVEVDLTAAIGVYTLTVTGTSGALVHSVDVSLEVTEAPPPPDFSMSADPTSLIIQQGTSDTSTITVTSLYGFTGTVDLTVSGEPSGVTATLDPTSVTPPADGSDTSTLTVQVDLTATVGVYTLTVTGTSGALVHSVDVSLEVTELPPTPDFSLSASPSSLTIQQGSSDTSTITVTSLNAFTGTVDLTVSGAPSGVTATLDPTSVTPPADGSDTSTLTVEVDLTASVGVYTLTVTGTSGALVHSVDVSLEITEAPPPPDFSISASPTSLTIQQGDFDTSVITITSLHGFSAQVDLSVSGVPSGVTATLSPMYIIPPPDGSEHSTLTVQVETTATPDTYTLTVTGTSNALIHSVEITLQITALPPEDTTPPSITINEPVSQDYLRSEAITIDFDVTDLQSGVASVTATLDGTPVTDGQVIELFTLSLGEHTFTVTAVDNAGNPATETVTFNVIATIDSLIVLVEKFSELGWINDEDFKDGLLAKLYAAKAKIEWGQMREAKNYLKTARNILNAFMNQVKADDHVTAEATSILIEDTEYVINHL